MGELLKGYTRVRRCRRSCTVPHREKSQHGTQKIEEEGGHGKSWRQESSREAHRLFQGDLSHEEAASVFKGSLTPIHSLSSQGLRWNHAGAEWRAGEFYKCLPPKAMGEFESLAAPFSCDADTVIFTEEQEALSVHFLLEGRVKLTMNSSEGKRMTLGFAGPGEILGLAASISGCSHVITASPSTLASSLLSPVHFSRLSAALPGRLPEFRMLVGYGVQAGMRTTPDSWAHVYRFDEAGNALAAMERRGSADEQGSRIHCSLTHGEIGEYIGVSRETISRNLADFKNLALVEQHGSTFLIPSLRALEAYAGVADY